MTARGLDREMTALCDVSLSLIAQVLCTPTLDRELADWERGSLLAGNQVFITLRAGWGLAFAGFPVQALALSRLAYEYYLLMRFCRQHPDHAARALKDEVTAGELGKTLFADDRAMGDMFKTIRSSLHRFAHQSPLALGLAIQPDKDGRSFLNLGPFVERSTLREAGYELLACSAFAIAELLRWLGPTDPVWSSRATTCFINAQTWLMSVRPTPRA